MINTEFAQIFDSGGSGYLSEFFKQAYLIPSGGKVKEHHRDILKGLSDKLQDI